MKTIQCTGKHTLSIIILHGFNQSVSDMECMYKTINKTYSCIKYLILESNDNKWYTYYTQRDNHNRHDKIDYKQFLKSCDELSCVIHDETKQIDSQNIYLLGISQGGTICINTSIRLKYKLGGIICIDTIFLSDYIDNISFVKQTFYPIVSTKDKIYNPNFQIRCYDLLKFYGNDVFIFKRNKGHCEDMLEIYECIKYILHKNNLFRKINNN